MVHDINGTLPRAFISVYVGLDTSNHHDGQDPFSEPAASSGIDLGTCSRGALLGSRRLPFPVFPWVIGGEEFMRPIAESMVAALLAFWVSRSGWRNFSDKRRA